MKNLHQADKINLTQKLYHEFSEEKPNQKGKISFQIEKLTKFFPKSYTPRDTERRIVNLIKDDYRRHQRNRSMEKR